MLGATDLRAIAALVTGWIVITVVGILDSLKLISVDPLLWCCLAALTTATGVYACAWQRRKAVTEVAGLIEASEAAITEVVAPIIYEQARRHSGHPAAVAMGRACVPLPARHPALTLIRPPADLSR